MRLIVRRLLQSLGQPAAEINCLHIIVIEGKFQSLVTARIDVVAHKLVDIGPFNFHLVGKGDHVTDFRLQELGVALENTLTCDSYEVVPGSLLLGLL